MKKLLLFASLAVFVAGCTDAVEEIIPPGEIETRAEPGPPLARHDCLRNVGPGGKCSVCGQHVSGEGLRWLDDEDDGFGEGEKINPKPGTGGPTLVSDSEEIGDPVYDGTLGGKWQERP